MRPQTRALLLALTAAIITGVPLRLRSIRNAHAHDCLADFATQVRPAMPRTQVAQLLQQASQKHQVADTTIDSYTEPTVWKLTAPSEWGATNWIIDLDFSPQGTLTHRRVRTADSASRRPDTAPPDF